MADKVAAYLAKNKALRRIVAEDRIPWGFAPGLCFGGAPSIFVPDVVVNITAGWGGWQAFFTMTISETKETRDRRAAIGAGAPKKAGGKKKKAGKGDRKEKKAKSVDEDEEEEEEDEYPQGWKKGKIWSIPDGQPTTYFDAMMNSRFFGERERMAACTDAFMGFLAENIAAAHKVALSVLYFPVPMYIQQVARALRSKDGTKDAAKRGMAELKVKDTPAEDFIPFKDLPALMTGAESAIRKQKGDKDLAAFYGILETLIPVDWNAV